MEASRIHPEGQFEAKVLDYGYIESKAGVPGVKIYCKTEFGTVQWTGYMAGKNIENVFKTIAACGFVGGDIERITEGLAGAALDLTKMILVTVEHEQSQNGKTYAKVQWINEPRAAKFDAQLSAGGKSKLSSMKGEWLAFKNTNGIKETKPETKLGF